LISWVFTISDFLAGIYSYIKVDGQDSHSYTTTQAALMIRECLSDVSQLNPVLDIEMSSSDAIVFVLRLLQSAVIARESSEGAVALLGWLELRLDDSPVLIAPGFNDGLIPEAINSDPFLPDRLRSTLGLTDNLKRYARDAYAISSMLASKERVILLSGRQSATGDPLAPSRLLLSSEPQKAAERLLAFYSPAVSSFNTVFDEMKSSQKMAASAAPSFEPYNFTTLSVTAFKDYLQCPYRFYLKHVLKLKRINDHQLELDGRAFGAVAHEALSQLNQSLKRELLCDQNEIFDLLSKCVEEKFLLLYGDEALPAVAFQKIQLLDRLRAFCKWQAQWSEEGWEIIASELSFDGSSTFLNVDGKPVGIKGRIDRLDYNPGSGEFAVFDYKTSDSQSSVEKSHKNKQAWIDLQLPLYYHMLSQSNIGGMGDITAERCKLGYISISRVSSEEKNGFSFASWGEAELEQAFNTAADVVRNIRVAKFWPPAKLRFDDELMALCQIAGEGL
jgi:RecB family exonuclease